MKRKILIHLYALAGGGAERVVAILATGLAERGHDVTLATDFSAPEAASLVSPAVRRLDLGRSHRGGIIRLAAHLRREKPDATLSATGVSNLKHALAAILAGRSRRAILTFHGDIRAERGRLSRIGNALSFLLTRWTGRSVFVSDDLKARFARLGASRSRAVRIYNPVPFGAAAAPRPSARTGHAPRLIGIGRLVPLKGFDTLLEAFARLPLPRARLTILGEGPERQRLQERITMLGLTGRVDLPGWADDPSLFYATSDCVVVSSRRESFSNVVVEALAAGLPVVATDCGGPGEILQRGRYGRLVPVDDVEALTNAMTAALADPGDPAPRQARAAEFSVATALDGYEALIEQVIAAA